jgi:hypothetical protein
MAHEVGHPLKVSGRQKWEGHVIEADDELISVELVPLDHEGPTLTADFKRSNLGPDEGSVSSGDVIYLTVRRVEEASGYTSTTSAIRLARLGRVSEAQIESARQVGRLRSRRIKKYAE